MYAYVCLCVYFSLFESVLHFIGWIKNAVYYLIKGLLRPKMKILPLTTYPHVGPKPIKASLLDSVIT